LPRRYSLAIAVLAAAVVFGAATPAASAKTPAPTVAMAGYKVKSGGATSATMSFRVPTLTCPKASSAYVTENLEMGTTTKKASHVDAVSSLIERCLGKSSAGYLELVSFPTANKDKYLSLTFAAGQTVIVTIDDSSTKSSVSVTTKGKTQRITGPGFVPSETLVGVVVYPAIASQDTKFSAVRFFDVKIDGKSLHRLTTTKLKARRGSELLAKPTAIRGGRFKVRYVA
jgi:hypothetical protein